MIESGLRLRNRKVIRRLAASLLTGFITCAAQSVPPQPTQIRTTAPAPGDVLHVIVGQSLLLHSDAAMKRVFVGNPSVISSFNSSATDVLVTAKEAGVSSLAIWDSNGYSRIYTVASDLDPSEMQRSVNQMYPAESIQVTAVGDRIQLNGVVSTQDVWDSLSKLGSAYSKQVANSLRIVTIKPKQVELKLQIIEVDRAKLDQFAVNFTSGGKTPATSGTGAFASPLNLSIGYLKESINLNIQALSAHSVLQILAEPTLITLSGQSARFLSGGEFPVPVSQNASTTGASGASNAITIQFRPYGVKVDFLPVIGPDGSIRLKIAPEVSNLDYANAVNISGFTIPALSTRRAETEIELKDGQSFVLSGLLDHRTVENLGRVPGIGNIPILGSFFRSHNNSHSSTELVFVVTAKIVDPSIAPEEMQRPTLVEPYMEPKDFDNEVHRKQAASTNR